MARFLALDWDAQHLHLVSGDVGRKGVRVDGAVSWPLPEELRPAVAENLGRQLRDFLKARDIAVAPVVACLGRERVILKDLRFPAVAAQEEPGLVRFQATKDLTDAPDEVILDYTHLRHPELDGERQAMVVIARRSLIVSLQALCRGLGVKLAAVTPRAYGLAGAWERARQQGLGDMPAEESAAVLSVGQRWAELCAVRGRQVLFARSLAVGPMLSGEVKRSLALHAAHNAVGPQAIVVAGSSEQEPVRARLEETLSTPVRLLDPFVSQENGIGRDDRSLYAAGVGLLHLWGAAGSFPINFLDPKQAKPVGEFEKRRKAFLGAAAGVIVLALIVMGFLQLSGKRKLIAQRTAEKIDAEEIVKKSAQERADVDALKDWDQGTIDWLDELHDLAARFPREEGFKINSLIASVTERKTAGKEKEQFVAKILMSGVAPKDQTRLVAQLVDVLNRDSHLRATVTKYKDEQFDLKVDIAKPATPALRPAPAIAAKGGQP